MNIVLRLAPSFIQQSILAISLIVSTPASAQVPGSIDHSFNPTDMGFGNGDGANGRIKAIATQADGKTLIAGQFTMVDGHPRSRVARMNEDGSLDTGFDAGPMAPNDPWDNLNTVATQPDGKCIIAGMISSVNGVPRYGIARLESDGSVDQTFDPGTGPLTSGGWWGGTQVVLVQPDGRILVGGEFVSFNGTPRGCIARLNTDGSVDNSFQPGTGATAGSNTARIQDMILLSDGKILIAGEFTLYNGTSRRNVARLNADGTLDSGFDPGTGAGGTTTSTIHAMAMQADGKILVGGGFTTFNGAPRNRLARLDANGALDVTFDPGIGIAHTNNSQVINDIIIRSDGRILIGGDFNSVDGVWRNNVARLNPNGSVDQSLNEGYGTNGTVHVLLDRPDGSILVGGWFTTYNWTGRQYLALIDTEASLLPMFEPFGTGANRSIYTTCLQPDGKVIIGGSFTGFNGTARNYIARLNSDGSLDLSFATDSSLVGTVYASALQANGKILIGGYFSYRSGNTKWGVARLHPNGSLDATFNSDGTGVDWGTVHAISTLPDGKTLLAGDFFTYNGIGCRRIVRLNEDGSWDNSFNPGNSANYPIRSMLVQPDGRVLIGGDFTSFNGVVQHHLARLEADGALDLSFAIADGFGPAEYHSVLAMQLQPDGKILLAGAFTQYQGVEHNGIIRVLPDGSADPTFDTGLGAAGNIHVMDLQADGRVLIGGPFTGYDGAWVVHRFARLNPDGSLDNSFNTGAGTATTEDPDQTLDYATVRSITLQPDGHILIAGDFTSYDGTGRNRIARVIGDTDTGVDDGLGTSAILHAYPNPTTDMLTVELPPAAEPRMLTIHDATGRVVEQGPWAAGTHRTALAVGGYPPGLYTVQVVGQQGVLLSRFIKP